MANQTQVYASFGPAGEVVCSIVYDDVTLQLLTLQATNTGAAPARVDVIRTSDGTLVGSRTVGAGTPAAPTTVTQNMRAATLTGVIVSVHGSGTAYSVPGYVLGGAYPA
jgi:hypothetical protein